MHTEKIRLSFIIVNWNTAVLLENALVSIQDKVGILNYEIIVVDNGSGDTSCAVVKNKFPAVRLIENKHNRGFARAVNQGIRISRGEYIVLFNTDALLTDGAVQSILDYMETHPNVGVCGGQLIYPDGRKQHSFDNFPTLLTELTNKSLLKKLFPKKYPGKYSDYSSPLSVDSLIGACFFVRKEAIEKTGLLDEDYFFFLEETDWCYRIKKAGYDIIYLPYAHIIHLQGKSAGMVPVRSRLEYYYSRYLFFIKQRGKFSAGLLIFVTFIKCIMKVAVYLFLFIFTGMRNGRLRYKLVLSAGLVWAHICLFPASMRLEGRS